jgi:hypothetical protein
LKRAPVKGVAFRPLSAIAAPSSFFAATIESEAKAE